MYEDSYWNQYEPIEYHWQIITVIICIFIFVTGTIANFAVIIHYKK
jgi:hypothetical protein